MSSSTFKDGPIPATLTQGDKKLLEHVFGQTDDADYDADTAALGVNTDGNLVKVPLEQIANGSATATPHRYLLSEVDTGKTWLSGQPIYRKVVELTNLPNTSTNTYPHGIAAFTNIISIQCVVNNGAGTWAPVPQAADPSTNSVALSVGGSDVAIQTWTDLSAFTGFVILEYVKT